MTSINMSY